MIKYYPLSFFFFHVSLFFLLVTPLEKGLILSDYTQDQKNSAGTELLKLTTTSTSPVWSPAKVTTGSETLEWKATATGMVDQVFLTSGSPIFDLSVDRTSEVTITASTKDGPGNLTELTINSLNINSLLLDNSAALTNLSCSDNQIKNLNLENNIALMSLFCNSNQINNLNIAQNSNLSILACFSNQIPEIDLSKNLLLTTLSCSGNLLQNLDLSNNKQLTALECGSNQLQDLNVQNGNNALILKFNTTNNSNLFCIQVDDVAYAEDNWIDIDPWTAFNKDCTFTNEPPVAIDDFYEVNENEVLDIEASLGVLSNDTDPDDDILMAILKDDASNGELELFPDGSFTYTPSPGFFGADTFTYVANDGEFDSNIATVSIEINMVNQAPVANDNNYTTEENITLDIEASEGVLSNDIDPDGDVLSAELSVSVAHGNLVFLSDGAFSYTPDTNYYGTDGFSYRAFDGFSYSNEAFVTISIQSVSELEIPNAFTPNNDGLNDFFRPVYRGMNNVELQVFDTWGNLVYKESGKALMGWDGNISNKSAENGNYLYRIHATTNEFKEIKKEGLFTLIK